MRSCPSTKEWYLTTVITLAKCSYVIYAGRDERKKVSL
ncbi:hypothetical protein T05_8559 [Trichinella murrelli]|uniref:Uncharacterized protein n=1 Tax=Trichinella murrelli TaxID=144512 RepID=A0A0V0SQV4_9BILA|nr:hypothetical protein T05_8559 [Trichinella murrelli]